jgi:hypothetical protein
VPERKLDLADLAPRALLAATLGLVHERGVVGIVAG